MLSRARKQTSLYTHILRASLLFAREPNAPSSLVLSRGVSEEVCNIEISGKFTGIFRADESAGRLGYWDRGDVKVQVVFLLFTTHQVEIENCPDSVD